MDNRDNLVVHLAGHLALHQYFGVQPFWIREAAGMDLEVTLLDKLFAPCGMNEFVPVRRPGSWRSDVARAWRGQSGEALRSVSAQGQGQFDYNSALRLLGLMRHLQTEQAEGLRELLLDPESLQQTLGSDWERGALQSLAKTEKKRSKSLDARVQKELRRARSRSRRRTR